MKTNSVRTRLTLWNIGVLALVLLALWLAVGYTARAYMLNMVDKELAGRVRFIPSVEQNPELVERFRKMVVLQRSMERRSGPERRRFRSVRVFDKSGDQIDLLGNPVRSGARPWDAHLYSLSMQGKRGYSTMKVDGEQTRVYSRPLLRDGGIVGVVQAARPLTELTEFLRGLTYTLIVLLPFALLAAGFGGMFLTGRWIRPVRDITRAAEELNAQDLSRRLPVTGNDEFSKLASTFNKMSGRLEDAFSKLEHSVQRQRRFTADASHELRTPLTTIKANSSLALKGTRSAHEYQESLAAIDSAANVMDRLIQDLLMIARSDDGQLLVETKPVLISDVLQRAISIAAPSPEQADVRLEIADPTLSVVGDIDHLVRLVLNLLDNALRHTPSGGQVTISAQREKDRAVIRVSDTGDGIPAEHLPHLCERFYRVDKARSRNHGGTGLGLAICQSIAQAHGGSLSISSTVGQGTIVTVDLPAETRQGASA